MPFVLSLLLATASQAAVLDEVRDCLLLCCALGPLHMVLYSPGSYCKETVMLIAHAGLVREAVLYQTTVMKVWDFLGALTVLLNRFLACPPHTHQDKSPCLQLRRRSSLMAFSMSMQCSHLKQHRTSDPWAWVSAHVWMNRISWLE